MEIFLLPNTIRNIGKQAFYLSDGRENFNLADLRYELSKGLSNQIWQPGQPFAERSKWKGLLGSDNKTSEYNAWLKRYPTKEQQRKNPFVTGHGNLTEDELLAYYGEYPRDLVQEYFFPTTGNLGDPMQQFTDVELPFSKSMSDYVNKKGDILTYPLYAQEKAGEAISGKSILSGLRQDPGALSELNYTNPFGIGRGGYLHSTHYPSDIKHLSYDEIQKFRKQDYDPAKHGVFN